MLQGVHPRVFAARGLQSKRVHVVDYLTELRLTEAPVTVPQSFATTLSFFERTAGIAKAEMLSEDAVFRKALDHTNKEMDVRRPEKKRAPLLPVKVIAALEMMVMSAAIATFVRFSAWVKLVKVWSASRTDDLQGISLASLKYNKVGGSTEFFWRTKVSGPGKKNKVLPFMISSKVSILESLDERRPASYEDFVVMSRLVYSSLKECFFEHGRWISGRNALLLPELVRYWTEHTERNWVISVAAASGIGREERQMLGRWAVKESSDEYIRSAQRIVGMVQCTLLERLRMDREWDLRNFGLEAVKDFITEINYDAESIGKQMEKLEMPEVWTPAELDGSFLGLVSRPPGLEMEETGKAAEAPESEGLPEIKEIMAEAGPEDLEEDEEDDIDVAGKFFISINIRNQHRKLHIWNKCGTKPGQNFAAMNPMTVSEGSSIIAYAGIAGRARRPKSWRTARLPREHLRDVWSCPLGCMGRLGINQGLRVSLHLMLTLQRWGGYALTREPIRRSCIDRRLRISRGRAGQVLVRPMWVSVRDCSYHNVFVAAADQRVKRSAQIT
eukprot:s3417_g6.t1